MSKPKLYGIANSRALRSIWAIEETGIEYEHVAVNYMEESKQADYLAVNPNGRIPALQDGDVVLCESMAINLYLAKTYGGGLYPQDAAGEAKAWQWSVWGISEIEPLQMQIVYQKLFMPEDRRDAGIIAAAEKGLQRPLAVLDAELEGKEWLLGDAFTIADLNLAAVMELLGIVEVDYSGFQNISRWAAACYGKPSYARAKAVGSAE
jgi:glutathione S-transferase